jgi:hypothetical protein
LLFFFIPAKDRIKNRFISSRPSISDFSSIKITISLSTSGSRLGGAIGRYPGILHCDHKRRQDVSFAISSGKMKDREICGSEEQFPKGYGKSDEVRTERYAVRCQLYHHTFPMGDRLLQWYIAFAFQ